MTLTEFLLARIAEDEYAARGARELGYLTSWVEVGSEDVDRAKRHFLKWEAPRVLAECEAKRRIIAEHHEDAGTCFGCGFGADEERMYAIEECPTLLALATVYADHPDFRAEWRP